jgi:hypothetical protein
VYDSYSLTNVLVALWMYSYGLLDYWAARDQILQQSKELEVKQNMEMEMQTLCGSFIKGQRSPYVLEDGNKIETDSGIEDNGPGYVECS